MADNNMINLKVFLRDDGTSEARRFTVDASVVTSFIFMKEKLQTVFPNLRETFFKITWKDNDGDEITIASDEDFITAFTEMNTSVKILYVTIVQNNSDPIFAAEAEAQEAQYQGPRIICDICNQQITGFRYKCMQCPDYDLCSTCEHQGHHSEHLMMRVPNNDVYMPKCARKFMHHVARSLKKSAYAASKEAHRAAKFAHKVGPQGRFVPEQERKEQPQPGCSARPQESSCPFTGEGINLNDVHALGAMAREHFAPILDVLRTTPSSGEPNGEGGEGNEGLFMDIIRNAVDGFFGKTSTGPNTDTNQSAPPTNDKKENPQNPSPMDVEGAAANMENGNSQEDKNKQDPGWTFVANKPQPDVASNEAVSQDKPSAPAFVYHENPKIAEGLVQLHEMGFSNESGFLTHLLERYEGNVTAVVKAIIDMKL